MTILRRRPKDKNKGYCFLFLNKPKKKKKLGRCEFSPSYVGKAKQHQIKAHGSFIFWLIQCRCESEWCIAWNTSWTLRLLLGKSRGPCSCVWSSNGCCKMQFFGNLIRLAFRVWQWQWVSAANLSLEVQFIMVGDRKEARSKLEDASLWGPANTTRLQDELKLFVWDISPPSGDKMLTPECGTHSRSSWTFSSSLNKPWVEWPILSKKGRARNAYHIPAYADALQGRFAITELQRNVISFNRLHALNRRVCKMLYLAQSFPQSLTRWCVS